jgi:hypothetical protein
MTRPLQIVTLLLLTVTIYVATAARQSLYWLVRQVWIYNGQYNGLEFGSYLPDAPHIFLTDRDFPDLWNGPMRVFLFVPPEQRQQALLRLPLDRAHLVAEKGGKALFVNRPLECDQPAFQTQLQIGAKG